MKRAHFSFALLVTAAALRAAANDGFIWVDLSFKAIRNPVDGSLPSYASAAAVDEALAHMNLMWRSIPRTIDHQQARHPWRNASWGRHPRSIKEIPNDENQTVPQDPQSRDIH